MRSSGFLIQEVEMMEPAASLCSVSSVWSCSLSLGEKELSHGTDFITRWYIHGWNFAVGQKRESRSFSVQ